MVCSLPHTTPNTLTRKQTPYWKPIVFHMNVQNRTQQQKDPAPFAQPAIVLCT
eukprot:m.369475 g.369475  ORF g.369475 m.369475 type:complete len:53 (+) comp20851_c0_seq4:2159-2317(+)